MTGPLLEYDESVDAAYLAFSDAEWTRQERLDDARAVNYAANGSVIGVELLSPRLVDGPATSDALTSQRCHCQVR